MAAALLWLSRGRGRGALVRLAPLAPATHSQGSVRAGRGGPLDGLKGLLTLIILSARVIQSLLIITYLNLQSRINMQNYCIVYRV